MNKNFNFLKSVRFWKLVLVGIAFALFEVGVINFATLGLIEVILIGSVAVRTVDRLGEKAGKTNN